MSVLRFFYLVGKPLVETAIFLPLLILALCIIGPIVWLMHTWHHAKTGKEWINNF